MGFGVLGLRALGVVCGVCEVSLVVCQSSFPSKHVVDVRRLVRLTTNAGTLDPKP